MTIPTRYTDGDNALAHLRGPADPADEKTKIETIAKDVAGADKVDNQ